MSEPYIRLYIPPFELDLATSTLWRETRPYRLKPQAAAVLRYLVEHAGHAVSKDELLAALWPEVHVHSGMLKSLIWELRQALHDRPQTPRFIETLPRLGYRFIGPLGRELQSTLALVQQGVPQHIHQMIERQLAQLSPEEQRVLEVASVAGAEFSAAMVAAGLATAVEEVEERCAGLAWHMLFVQPCGLTEWPDGTVATRYAFFHALYAQVLYERLPAGRCRALHVRLGQRLEQAYGVQTRGVSAELALHFERGREYSRAIHYLR